MLVIARTLVGLPLAAVLGIVGMAIASAMSVFFGVSALPTLLLLLTIGAGIGAGIGGGAMLIRVDAVPPWPVVLAIGVGICLVSAGGAWAGLEIGDKITAMQEMNCVGVCDYFFKPRTYMALGATVVSNAVAVGNQHWLRSASGRLGLAPLPARRYHRGRLGRCRASRITGTLHLSWFRHTGWAKQRVNRQALRLQPRI